jgi:cation-transporting ATPase E
VLLTTLAFLLAALQLTRHQALVQELPAVEGLARVDVICLDKTGTLTQGEIVFDRCETLDGQDPAEALAALGAVVHDPTPNATALAVAAHVADPGLTVVKRVAFSSARKFSAAQFDNGQVWVFGAPEVVDGADLSLRDRIAPLVAAGVRVVVLAKADALVDWQQITPVALVRLTEAVRPDAARTLAYFASQDVAVKVISGDNPVTVAAVARQVGLPVVEADGSDEVAQAGVTAGTGLTLAAADAADRPGVAKRSAQGAVADGGSVAGGGSAADGGTAAPVSWAARPGTVVDARTLPDTVEELAELVDGITVFGRVTPEKKRLIVNALQRRGHTVAMTGDGVNDVLALKDADIGIAMGNGAQATKAVAQIVLLDSRFSHLP